MVTAADASGTAAPLVPPAATTTLFGESFDAPDGLLTNEWAFWNHAAPGGHQRAGLFMPSGSLFARGQAGWTGTPDRGLPDADGTSATASAVFRLVTDPLAAADTVTTLSLRPDAYSAAMDDPRAGDTYGTSVWLRYTQCAQDRGCYP